MLDEHDYNLINTHNNQICHGSTSGKRRNTLYICGVIYITSHVSFPEDFPVRDRVTRRSSSIRSAKRTRARAPHKTIVGSGAARSVHCGGTEHMVSLSTCSKIRLPHEL